MEYKEYKGKNVDEAITNACVELGISADKLDYEVVEKGSNGFLGIGSKAAIIKARKNQSIEDIALMREMPNMTVFVPCDPKETEKAVMAAAEIDGPVYIRVARPVCEDITEEDTPFIPGKANIMRDGNDVCIITAGLMVPIALKAAEELEKEGISAAVVNMHTIKPIDAEIILEMNKKCKGIVTAEEHSVIGGLGSAVAEVLAGNAGAKFERVGIQDKFGKSGKPDQLFAAYGLTAENIIEKCKATLA